MAGYFNIGETKVRPSAYFHVASAGDDNSFGAVDGVVAVLFRSNMGPLGVVNVIDVTEGYEQVYGNEGTTDALREAAYGGARTLVAIRIGSGGAAASVELTAATGKLKVAAKSVGNAGYAVTVRNSLTDSSKKEIIFYKGTTELEKYEFASGGDEVAEAIAATAGSARFLLSKVSDGAGVITNVSQTALTGGTDPTVTNQDYSNAFLEIEKYYFNTICVDTSEAAVHTLLAAFLDRIYQTGKFGIGVVAQAHTVALATRMTAAAAFNSEKMVFPLNAYVGAGDTELDGYPVAAYYAGLIASTPSNESITHSVIGRFTDLKEVLTNSQIEAAEQSGCLVLSTSSSGAIWSDNGNNTLVTPDSNHDSGWKKIRRTRARFELMYRANSAADSLVGQVDNNKIGRAAIAAAIQEVGNDMIEEGKIQYFAVAESTKVSNDGDTCGFDMDIIDLDSAEHIYLFYNFRFSTVVPE